MGILPASEDNFDGGLMSRDDFKKLSLSPSGTSLYTNAYSDEIDFTIAGKHLVSRPAACRPAFYGAGIVITQSDGIASEANIKMGTNDPDYDDICPLQATVGFLTEPLFGQIFLVANLVSMSMENGVYAVVTTPVLATACKGRLLFFFCPIPL